MLHVRAQVAYQRLGLLSAVVHHVPLRHGVVREDVGVQLPAAVAHADLQRLELALLGLRQGIVGGDEVGEQGVAAVLRPRARRRRLAVKDRGVARLGDMSVASSSGGHHSPGFTSPSLARSFNGWPKSTGTPRDAARDAARDATLSRLENKVSDLEMKLSKIDRWKAEISGKCWGISEELQPQIQRIHQLEMRMFEWRKELESDTREKVFMLNKVLINV